MRSSLLAQYLIYIGIYLSEGLAQVVIYEERNLESKNNLEDGKKGLMVVGVTEKRYGRLLQHNTIVYSWKF